MDTTTWVIIGVLSAAGAGALYFLYRKGRAPKEEAIYYHRCPRCNRKLSYRAHQTTGLMPLRSRGNAEGGFAFQLKCELVD